jgi:hypothetical protein
MALSRGFKSAMKFRKRRSRRWEVALFATLVVTGIVGASEGSAFFLPLVVVALSRVLTSGMASWDWRRRVIPVSTLDDRAMLEYGTVFDALTPVRQDVILSRYRGGTRLLNYFPDECEDVRRNEANRHAFLILRWLLPVLLLACWLRKATDPRAHVLMLIFWVVMAVLALPQLILLWTEPDDVGEMDVVAAEEGRKRDAEA